MGESNVAKTRRIDLRLGHFQHVLGSVEAKKEGVGMSLRKDDQIPSRTASDFQDSLARVNIHVTKQKIAPEKIVLSRDVIEVPLQVIHAIHFFERVCHCDR